MDKLKKLLSLCKFGVYVTVNRHRDYYDTVERAISEMPPDWLSVSSGAVLKKMIETDTIVEIQYYQFTPVGFNVVHHYDIEMALDEALADTDRFDSEG